MKPHSFLLDRKLFEILTQEKKKTFTTKELRDSYAATLTGSDFKLADVRLYVYEEIRRMIRVSWVVPDRQKKTRDQKYYLQSQPSELSIEFIEHGFTKWLRGGRRRVSAEIAKTPDPEVNKPRNLVEEVKHLESLMKEVQLELLASVGEAERYKQLMADLPDIRNKIEKEYLSIRDQSSRLLGHVRAIEKTLKLLASA